MALRIFDGERRGQVIMQAELNEYSRLLASAVTEALYYFIGRNPAAPPSEARYLAVTAAHITHMLRDAWEDAEAGYFNIPHEYLQVHACSPVEIGAPAYREWVRERVQLARRYFRAGREYLAKAPNLRCRLAGFAYTARFEWMLAAIERDHYCLRAEYPERKSLYAGLWMIGTTLRSMTASFCRKPGPISFPAASISAENSRARLEGQAK